MADVILLKVLVLIFLCCHDGTCYRACFKGKCVEVKLKSYPFWIQIVDTQGTCTNPGYTPGGGQPNIKPIPDVLSKGSSSAVSTIIGVSVSAVGHVSTGISVMEALEKGGDLFLKIAPKLAASLGVFGAGMGFVTALLTTDDALAKVNSAISKLTKEVNQRLDRMKDYVDSKVIQLEKDLINKEYRTLWNLFSFCIKEHTVSSVNKCIRDAEKQVSISSPKFMILETFMNVYFNIQTTDPKELEKFTRNYFEEHKDKVPSLFDVKRLEVGLLNFRDYADLHLIVLGTLVNTYKDAKGSDQAYYKRYLQDERNAGRKYAAYAKWAIAWIKMRNTKENRKIEGKCDKAKLVSEGWKTTHTRVSCSTTCTLMLPKDECKYSVKVRTDGKTPSEYRKVNVKARSGTDGILSSGYYGETFGGETCQKLLDSLQEDIETYWKNVLGINILVWEATGVKAENELKRLPSGDVTFHEDNASKDFPNRLRIARKEAIKNHLKAELTREIEENDYLKAEIEERSALESQAMIADRDADYSQSTRKQEINDGQADWNKDEVTDLM